MTHYQSPDIQAAIKEEIAAHQVALANQRARVRGAKLAAPKRAKSEANTRANERRDALLEHLNETP